MPSTAEQIAAIEAALPCSYAPPFEVACNPDGGFVVMDSGGSIISICDSEDDARLLCALLNAAPGIIAAAKRMLAAPKPADTFPQCVWQEMRDTVSGLIAPLYAALVAAGAVEQPDA